MDSSAERYDPCPKEALRKLAQLHPHLDLKTQDRCFNTEEIASSDLAGYVLQGENVDTMKLIPFLISAVNHLSERLQLV